MSEETIVINSLQDFISILEEEKFSGNFYFRGEPMDYSSMVLKEGMAPIDTRNMASGYRWALQNEKTFDDILWLRKDYYREVGHSLTSKETENFIAYAQHHGLPTELLDITLNPAVALYFACEQNQDKDGYVYLFNNNGYVQEGNNIEKFYRNLYYDLTESLISIHPEKQYLKFKWFTKIFDDHIQKEDMEEVNGITRRIFLESNWINIFEDLYNRYHEYKKLNKDFVAFDQSTSEVFEAENFRDANNVLRKMLSEFSVEVSHRKKIDFIIDSCIMWIHLRHSNYFPDIVYLKHKPSIIFDRMRNQSGEFIYQLSYDLGRNCMHQQIKPSHVFTIRSKDKKRIFNQLNNIGINQKFIYPDVDNTAKYIANTYEKSYYKERHPFEHLSFK